VILWQASSTLDWAFGMMTLVFLAAVLWSASYLHDALDKAIRRGLEQRRLVAQTQAALAERERAQAELERYRARLEEMVAQRTAALEQANRELDSFSYSVSHDLRAPLRTINGFASALQEDHAGQLSEDAQTCVRMIREGCERMGRLIEATLTFCRLGQQAVTVQPVNMEALVHEAVGDLVADREGSRVQLSICKLPPCAGDSQMLKQVWFNLLSNAFKFTRGRELAVIEAGFSVQDRECVYFVRDNGAGFDMRYADKLFGMFQRLHSEREFEGTGVGLAIANRIITRHGGRMWAQGEKGRGAVFFFTVNGA
jgi:light-regulated signal transduction histidine kinase (bacteriophytochrome)